MPQSQPRMTDDGKGWSELSSHSLAIDDISLYHGRNKQMHSVDMHLPEAFDLQ
jgi:hypothetical protein